MIDPKTFWNNAHNRTTFWQLPFEVIEPILKELPKRPHVLDIGCGKGDLLKRIHDATGAFVEGIDVSDLAIETAKNLIPGGIFRADDFEEVELTETYDLIIFHLSLAFMDVHQALKKAASASKRILIITPVRESIDGAGLTEKDRNISVHRATLEKEIGTFFRNYSEIYKDDRRKDDYTPLDTFYCVNT